MNTISSSSSTDRYEYCLVLILNLIRLLIDRILLYLFLVFFRSVLVHEFISPLEKIPPSHLTLTPKRMHPVYLHLINQPLDDYDMARGMSEIKFKRARSIASHTYILMQALQASYDEIELRCCEWSAGLLKENVCVSSEPSTRARNGDRAGRSSLTGLQ